MMGKVKTQPSDWVGPPTLPHNLANINGQWHCKFWRLDLISFTIFAHVSFTTSDNFLNSILSVSWWERWKLSPQTEFGLPSHPTTLPHQWAVAGLFWRLDLISFTSFHVCFLYYIWCSFQLNTLCAMMGKVKTQPAHWVWPPTPITALSTSMRLREASKTVI